MNHSPESSQFYLRAKARLSSWAEARLYPTQFRNISVNQLNCENDEFLTGSLQLGGQFNGGGNTGTPQGDKAQQYEVIGAALLRAEVVSSRVGIPWLWPTRRVRKCARDIPASLWELLKQELVTVSTKYLEEYAYDLENLPDEPASSRALHIDITSGLERWSFSGLLVIFFVACVVTFAAPIHHDPLTVGLFGCVGALVGFCIGAFLSSDRSRRMAFDILIHGEIKRRQGLDGDDSRRVPLTIDPTPIK